MGYILTGSSKITCPHGGDVQHSSKSLDVPYIHGYPMCVMNDRYDISGCPLWGASAVPELNGGREVLCSLTALRF